MILLVALISIAIELNVVCSVCWSWPCFMCGVVVLLFFTKELDYRAKRGFLVMRSMDGTYLSTMSPLSISWNIIIRMYSYVEHNPQHTHNVINASGP